jgi:hypothetical protein
MTEHGKRVTKRDDITTKRIYNRAFARKKNKKFHNRRLRRVSAFNATKQHR